MCSFTFIVSVRQKNVGANNSIDFFACECFYIFKVVSLRTWLDVWRIRKGLTNSINFHKSSEEFVDDDAAVVSVPNFIASSTIVKLQNKLTNLSLTTVSVSPARGWPVSFRKTAEHICYSCRGFVGTKIEGK